MADKIKFGASFGADRHVGQTNGQTEIQREIQTDSQSHPSQVCAHIEAMLTDALDGTLSATDQALFDAHTAHCAACSSMLADARRGAAWLDLLRSPRPEPPVALLERILAQTSGSAVNTLNAGDLVDLARPGIPAPAFGNVFPMPPAYGVPVRYGEMQLGNYSAGKVLSFRSRVASVTVPLAHLMMQPRLMMTAAMAFFSIAMTLNLTGVRLQDLKASNLRPENLRRGISAANVRVAQYYEGIRVVHELESRVEDLRASDARSSDAFDTSSGPAQRPSSRRIQSAPDPDTQPAEPRPQRRPAPDGGTSRREMPASPFKTVASTLTAPAAQERRSL